MISVCIATYNGSSYIKEQLDSILMQLHKDDEVIISDDCSTDNTLNIIESYNDHRIKIVRHTPQSKYGLKIIRNMNLASLNFANAIENATGDIIFLSDQDDIWYPDKVKKMFDMMSNDNISVLLHNFAVIDSSGTVINPRVRKQNPISPHLCMNYYRRPFMGCCMAFTKEIKSVILPMPKALVTHDQYIGLLAMKKGFKVSYVDEILLKRREHFTNASLYKNPSVFEKVRYNYLLFKSIFLHCF